MSAQMETHNICGIQCEVAVFKNALGVPSSVTVTDAKNRVLKIQISVTKDDFEDSLKYSVPLTNESLISSAVSAYEELVSNG
jgi:hypothetical protein